MLLAELVSTSRAVAGTASRSEKVRLIAAALRGLDVAEVEAGVAYLSGELRQRNIGVGWASLRDLSAPAAPAPALSVADVDRTCEAVGAMTGPGSQAARTSALYELFAAATGDEQDFLRALLSGELRQGALAGVMTAAIAVAAGLSKPAVERAAMLRGDLRAVAAIALRDGEAGLARLRLEVGRPVLPMLAAPAADPAEAWAKAGPGPVAVEHKLDGARLQVHRDGEDVALYSRSLDDITAKAPEVVAAVRALAARTAVLDGEVIALRPDGRPEPFQVTGARLASGRPGLTFLAFDVLHLDGEDLLDAPGATRAAALARSGVRAVPRSVAHSEQEVAATFEAAVAAGQEGVIVKSLEAPYAAGRRGAGWLKLKPRHTLDLVILAAEWGHGRRHGWLSNLHLGARGPDGLVMLGKTFKGLTDAMLTWQTEALLALETQRTGHVVHVRPELLVEIAIDGIQRSSRYPGGVALRFARVLRHRPDKPAAEADTLETVLAIGSG